MTVKDRADSLVELSGRIADFLAMQHGPMGAGDLVKQFWEQNPDVALPDVEVALSLLLNKHRVIVDSDMLLAQVEAEAA